MKKDQSKDEFAPEEARKRFEAALRGARIAGPKHRTEPKRKKLKRKKANAVPR